MTATTHTFTAAAEAGFPRVEVPAIGNDLWRFCPLSA
jgi:hypothetical protein